MAKYPIYLELSGRRVVIIGAGPVAVRKAQTLLEAGARLIIIAEQINDMPASLCSGSDAELIKSRYSKEYLAGAVLVIAATNKPKLNEQIYKDCQKLEILCNVVDEPQLCDFFVPAVTKRGGLQIAVGTDGHCPAYAGHIRKKLEKIFTDKHGEFLAELEPLRKQIIENMPDPADRKTLLGQLVNDKSFEYFTQNGPDKWRDYANQLISKQSGSGADCNKE